MNETITIKDKNGCLRMTIRKTSGQKTVFDKTGKLIGTIRNGNTYDKNGALVATGEDVGLLGVGI